MTAAVFAQEFQGQPVRLQMIADEVNGTNNFFSRLAKKASPIMLNVLMAGASAIALSLAAGCPPALAAAAPVVVPMLAAGFQGAVEVAADGKKASARQPKAIQFQN